MSIMLGQPFRLQPAGPVQAYRTYELDAPASTHRRRASCEEVDCGPHAAGWTTRVDAGGDQEAFLRRVCAGDVDGLRRAFAALPVDGEGRIGFAFPPGQPCLKAATHTVPLERTPTLIVRGGDWRGNPTGERRVHARTTDWVEDFAENQLALHDRIEKG